MVAKRPIPLSENVRKFHPKWTKDDCIAELKRIAEANPNQVITRNFFRVHSDISESTWNRYFGTFHEFKRQAGIILSRHAHRLEKAIAKHASVDLQREMNKEKMGYEGKYLKPDDRRWQTIVVVSDLHDKNCDPFYRRVVMDTLKRIQPQKLVINGDGFDLPEFSKYTQDPRKFELVARIEWMHQFLADVRITCPNTEIIFVEGNHEFRLIRHLTEATPALMTILGDLHGWTVPKLLGLDTFEVNYIARMDLTAFNEADIRSELKKNYYIAYDAVLHHHHPEGRTMGYPGTNGHHHKHQVWPVFHPVRGPSEWHQTGAGHARRAHYCAAEKWSLGFLIEHVDTVTKAVAFEYVDVTHDFAVVGGKYYTRTDAEKAAVQ